MDPQVLLDLLLGGAWLATFVPMVLNNVRKETVARQAELIETLVETVNQQDEMIKDLQHRLRKLEGKDAWESRVVPKGPPNRNGRGGHS